jgi:selenocysteine-specific translation elongation factor
VTRVRKEVPDCELIFVATKSDQITAPGQRERVIDAAQQALGCISSKGMYLTSAANGDGVDELFRAAAELYVPNKGVRIDKGKPLQGTEAPSPCC